MSTIYSPRVFHGILRGIVLLYLSMSLQGAQADGAGEPTERAQLPAHDIMVLTMFKKIEAKPEDALVFAGCNDWQMSAARVVEYFSWAEKIAPEETHSYAWFACRYTGTLLMDGTAFEFEINAGLTGWLGNQATTERELVNYGCKKACKNLTPFGDNYEYVD